MVDLFDLFLDLSNVFVLHAVKHGVSQSGGQAQHRALHDAAQGIPLGPGRGDALPHLHAFLVVHHREVLLRRGGVQRPPVADAADLGNAGDDRDPLPLQKLLADAAGNAERCCQPPGEVSAAGIVLVAAVFYRSGIVRMAGARQMPQVFVVL